jgi:hypothetical protein
VRQPKTEPLAPVMPMTSFMALSYAVGLDKAKPLGHDRARWFDPLAVSGGHP